MTFSWYLLGFQILSSPFSLSYWHDLLAFGYSDALVTNVLNISTIYFLKDYTIDLKCMVNARKE